MTANQKNALSISTGPARRLHAAPALARRSPSRVRTANTTANIHERSRSALQANFVVELVVVALVWMLMSTSADLRADEWQPAAGPLASRWAQDVSPANVHPEYPRPQMERATWLNLNGLWDYAIAPVNLERPACFDGQILVPFPVESALSGVLRNVGPGNRLWYRRSVNLPGSWTGKRVLLHFAAVDWEATIFVNGREVGLHRGGYDPFCFDITEALEPRGEQEIVLSVWDPIDAGFQPRGKQVAKPRGIWYTPTTGIWGTAWLEPVSENHITGLRMVPDVDARRLDLVVQARTPQGSGGHPDQGRATHALRVRAVASVKGNEVARAEGHPGDVLRLAIAPPRLWSPADPFLYDLEVTLLRGETAVDRVSSYFGLRKICLAKDANGVLRLFLNNKPLFQYGPLDQGFWPDGLYTAPTDEALRYDIEVTKRLGFNMARKHVKIERDRWYYWCDRLGLLVWQDMPSGDGYIGGRDPDLKRTAQSARQFDLEYKRNIDALVNHPCIVMWVPFNEGWGQFDTERIASWTKSYDPTRLVNSASGWTDRGVGDVHDIHSYPGPAAPPNEPLRAAVLGEFGGLGLPLEGHTWQDERNWGYRSFEDRESLSAAYVSLLRNLEPLIGEGLAAAVYTQTTDVEIEVNGLMTYDRAVIKIDPVAARGAALRLYAPPPRIVSVLTSAKDTLRKLPIPAPTWRYTLDAPGHGWEQPGFKDTRWSIGAAGFGRHDTPGALVNTAWETSAIWLRRTFELESTELESLHLSVHHDEDCQVFLNGKRVAELAGYTSSYVLVPLDEAAVALLHEGKNTIAVHCRQTDGGQYIDVGLVNLLREEDR